MNNTITEMKNTLEGMNSRITEEEEQVSDLEDNILKKLPQSRIQKKE